ncbi:pseudouridine synthase [Spirosoma agri]|uniref:Pseudouridine synthase n=1 Tax=Spirosoma agri TaxID=1987381 RepID=A0A6M0ILD2_9BACT|nr:pseudouridine synthase [Spirosoma agri]NEU68954.1 pseudouridine synthase [Spirosoma agri]
MNQDSDKNDRRDGESRSSGRRDDGPRFNRATGPGNRSDKPRDNNDRPRFSRSNDRPDGDKPRFSRDSNRDDKPRFNSNRNDRPTTSRDNSDTKRPDSFGDRRPRTDRDERSGSSFNRDRNNERPSGGFNRDRNEERPRFPRSNDRDDKPRFGSNRNDAPRGRSQDRSGDSRPARDGERPRFNRDDKPGFERNNDRFGTERKFNDRSDDRSRADRSGNNRFGNDSGRSNNRTDGDRPRFPRSNDRPRDERAGGGFNRDRNEERPRFPRSNDRDDKPRFNSNRSDRPDSRGSDRNTGNNSRFPRERTGDSRFGNSDKPAFKRVGGFSREADERNRLDSDDNNRRNSRQGDAPDPNARFSGEQRKESGDRRTGRYEKAPDYNLEKIRAERYEKPRGNPRQKDDSDRPKRATDDDRDADGLTRLNRYIANSGVCSRREADELIARGDISVNGKTVTEMGFKVKEGDTVKYGTKILNPERFVYVLMNKPKDYITTTEDPEERKTVMQLVADAGNFRMYPVGRLDRNTTGLLLLTNDGELADKLTHPSNNIRKIYQVELNKPITTEHFEEIQKGLTLEDGPIKPDAFSIVTPDAHVVGIEIHSGRNRIVRRIFEHLGYDVTKLDRTTYAGLTKKDLPRGKWRFLDPKEVVKLKYFNN